VDKFRRMLLLLTVHIAGCVTSNQTATTPDLAFTLLNSTGGFTLSSTGENLANSGLFAVSAYPERGQKFDIRPGKKQIEQFQSVNSDVLGLPDHTLGGWCEGAESAPPCYLDVSIVIGDESQAVALGNACNQQSIAHLANKIRFIDTGGNGDPLQGVALDRCRTMRKSLSRQ
jgi:hypothetical protein